ncbi:hypothetical protein VNI00_007355 [Paramarasmius palmivorus]|uniref:Uncharacterized protein n=1 Tax=Paramarasmius palmivorus TaxID=297713 RepID=A0AAW0D242_9AGAR
MLSNSHFLQLEVHTAHASLSKGLDHSSGVFDLSVFSSILSLTTYLLEIAPLCLPSFGTSFQDLNDRGTLPIWRLDSLPPEREDQGERLRKWIAEHTLNMYSRQPSSSQVSHQSPLNFSDSRKRLSEKDNSHDSSCSPERDIATGDFFSSSSGVSVESSQLKMIMTSCSEEDEQTGLDTAAQVLADRFTRYIFWPVTPLAQINTAPLQKLQAILQQYVEVGTPMIELPPAYRTRGRLEEIALGLNSAAGDEIYTVELTERYCDILFELNVERQLRICIGMTPLRTLGEGELDMLLKCIPGILNVSEQAAHSKIECRLPWDSLLDLVFASCGKEAIISRTDRRIHLSRNHSCDFSQSAGYRPRRMYRISSLFSKSMDFEEPTLEPLTAPFLKPMSALIHNQGNEARRKYLILMESAVFDRSCTIDIAMHPWSQKATREEIFSRAITSDFTYAVSDRLVAVRPDILVPRKFAAEYGFFLSRDVSDSADSSTAAAAAAGSTKSQRETDFSIFRSFYGDVKSLTKSILEQNELSKMDSDAAIFPSAKHSEDVQPQPAATVPLGDGLDNSLDMS